MQGAAPGTATTACHCSQQCVLVWGILQLGAVPCSHAVCPRGAHPRREPRCGGVVGCRWWELSLLLVPSALEVLLLGPLTARRTLTPWSTEKRNGAVKGLEHESDGSELE